MPISFEKFLTENECDKNDPQSEVNKLKNHSTVDDHCDKKSRKNLVSFINNSFASIKTWQKPVLPVNELFHKRQKCKRKEKQPQVKVESKPKKKEGKRKSFNKKTFSKTSHNSKHSKYSTTASKSNSNNSLTTNKSHVEIAVQTSSVKLKHSKSISTKSVEQDQETKEVTNNTKTKYKLRNCTNNKHCFQIRNSTSCLSYPNKLKCVSSISLNTGKPGEDFVLERIAENQKRKRNYVEYKLEEMFEVTATMFARTQIEVLYNANTNGLEKFNQFIDDLRIVNS